RGRARRARPRRRRGGGRDGRRGGRGRRGPGGRRRGSRAMTTLTPPQQGSAPADETLESTSRSDAFAGAGTLFRFNLRRDRVRLPVWVLAVAFAAIATAVNIEQLYPDAADRASAAQTMDSPTTLAMVGPGHYLD